MYAFSSLGFLQSLVSGGFRENIHDGSSSFRKGRLRPVNSALTGSDNTQLALRGNSVSTTIHLKQRVESGRTSEVCADLEISGRTACSGTDCNSQDRRNDRGVAKIHATARP